MTTYRAGRLDARNVGSSVGVDMGDERIFGTVTAIHRSAETVVIYLADNESPLELDHEDEVDVHLSSVALYALHTKNELERLREDVQSLNETVLRLIPATSPLLKAV